MVPEGEVVISLLDVSVPVLVRVVFDSEEVSDVSVIVVVSDAVDVLDRDCVVDVDVVSSVVSVVVLVSVDSVDESSVDESSVDVVEISVVVGVGVELGGSVVGVVDSSVVESPASVVASVFWSSVCDVSWSVSSTDVVESTLSEPPSEVPSVVPSVVCVVCASSPVAVSVASTLTVSPASSADVCRGIWFIARKRVKWLREAA